MTNRIEMLQKFLQTEPSATPAEHGNDVVAALMELAQQDGVQHLAELERYLIAARDATLAQCCDDVLDIASRDARARLSTLVSTRMSKHGYDTWYSFRMRGEPVTDNPNQLFRAWGLRPASRSKSESTTPEHQD